MKKGVPVITTSTPSGHDLGRTRHPGASAPQIDQPWICFSKVAASLTA